MGIRRRKYVNMNRTNPTTRWTIDFEWLKTQHHCTTWLKTQHRCT